MTRDVAEPAPPPFVFSRESRIRIDREGHFWHEGERIEHAGLAAGLARWITVDETTGRYILRNTLDWCFITVDDTPLVVRAVEFPADSPAAVLVLSDGTRETLRADTVRVTREGGAYCTVRDGTIPARFARGAAFELLDRAQETADGYVLSLPGGDVPVRWRDA